MEGSVSPNCTASATKTMIEPGPGPGPGLSQGCGSESEFECEAELEPDCVANSNSIQNSIRLALASSQSKSKSKSNPTPTPTPILHSTSNPIPDTPNPIPDTPHPMRPEAKQQRTGWLMSKIAIPVVLGTVLYSAYVFLATLLIPALALSLLPASHSHSHSHSHPAPDPAHSPVPLSPAQAIPLSVSLSISWLILLWSYLRVCLTPAGFVPDHHQPSSPPPHLLSTDPSILSTSSLSPAFAYSDHPINPLSTLPPSPTVSPSNSLPHSPALSPRQSVQLHLPGPGPGIVGAMPAPDKLSPRIVARGLAVVSPAETQDTNLTKVDASDELAKRTVAAAEPAPLLAALHRPQSPLGSAQRPHGSVLTKEEPPPSPGPPSPPPTCTALFSPARTSKVVPTPPPPPQPAPSNSIDRIPPNVDIHDLAARYCRKCRTVKSLRAHHCRHCATCVLKMDHHCPWVGRCVGARNYKFFYNFLQWSTIYCTHIFLVILIVNVRPGGRPDGSVNRHHAAILGLSGLFMLFTGSLLLTHTYLIMHNLSTIEHMAIERHRRRERRAVALALGRDIRWSAKVWETRKVIKRFDREWGTFVREGNVWFLGWRKNWESVMGSSSVGWILPIRPRPRRDAEQDGLVYDVNPRCDERGKWRPRKEWPVELQ